TLLQVGCSSSVSPKASLMTFGFPSHVGPAARSFQYRSTKFQSWKSLPPRLGNCASCGALRNVLSAGWWDSGGSAFGSGGRPDNVRNGWKARIRVERGGGLIALFSPICG